VYTCSVDVAVTELRAHLSRWIEAARDGNDIVITDRGTPVARIVALDSTRPVAGDRQRPTPKRPVADIVSDQRR
jgi:prevent-host-death family protein